MNEPTLPQIRSFRLKNHHLDQKQAASLKSVQSLSAACGFQNTPPEPGRLPFTTASKTRIQPGCKVFSHKKISWFRHGASVAFL